MKKLFGKYEVDEKGNVYNLDGKPRKTDPSNSYVFDLGQKILHVSKLKAYAMTYLNADKNDIIEYNGGEFKNAIIHKIQTFLPICGHENYGINKNGLIIRFSSRHIIKRYEIRGFKYCSIINENRRSKYLLIHEALINTHVFNNNDRRIISYKFKDGNTDNITIDNLSYELIDHKPIKGSNYVVNITNKTLYNSRNKEVKPNKKGIYNIRFGSFIKTMNINEIIQLANNNSDISLISNKKKLGCLEALKIDHSEAGFCSRIFKDKIYSEDINTWDLKDVKTFKNHLNIINDAFKKPLHTIQSWEIRHLRKKILSLL